MIESWLIQLRLFPRQFWQDLQGMAQRFLTALVGLVMPVVLWVGFSPGSIGAARPIRPMPSRPDIALGLELWRNLSHPLVESKCQPVPGREQCDRRGAMQDWRAGQALEWQPVLVNQQPHGQVFASLWLPALIQFDIATEPPMPPFQVQPRSWTYQTLLPWRDPF